MVYVIEYKDKKKYVRDMKMGRRWRVPIKGEKGKDGKGGEEEGGVENIEEENKEVLSGHCGPTGDQEVPKINWLPGQKITFHEVGERDCSGAEG